ncbi:polyphosphate kinase 1 [bacterium]|nr:polyphosphate kinase 1 [bacterium]
MTMVSKAQDPTLEKADHALDFSFTQNRELSWLQFDNRVLDEGRDASVPLIERLKMASIFESNLDEFFMIRVGSLSELAALKVQPVDNKSNETPREQVDAIYEALPALIEKHERTVQEIERDLAEHGLVRVNWREFTDADRKVVENYFDDNVLPIVSPQIIDPRHPFPNLRNTASYAVYNLASADEAEILGLVEIPPALPRIITLSSTPRSLRYTLLEDVILSCAPGMFGDYHTSERAVIRVTRNADIDPDEGSFDMEEDYRAHMKKILKQRLRLNPVRLEVQGEFSKTLVKQMRKSLGLNAAQVFRVEAPLSMGGYAFDLQEHVSRAMAEELCYPPFSPQACPNVLPDVPMWKQIREHDILLFYPYESMEPFLRLLHESANDPEVLQIKITLYRVAKKSRLCESLITAAENGIDVTVLMELRARFDEENNIEWAERLEDAGCTVLYGSEGFKVHSKICQITRRNGAELLRITQLGTGNYNEKTARLYSDYSLMTVEPHIGEDANRFFRNLQIGNLQGEYHTLGVAPVSLKPLIMRGLNREIAKARAGERAFCFFKMNSITDREVIDKISEASCAGVCVNMIVRGICCLVPGIPGKTENVHVRSIVGRMLEHARVYEFGVDHDTMYLSSADMMTRNTEHRVEIAYPLLNPVIRDQVHNDLEIQWADNVKARELQPDGTYAFIPRKPDDPLVDAQETFMRRALKNAEAHERELAAHVQSARHRTAPGGASDVAPATEASPAPAAPEPLASAAPAPAPAVAPASAPAPAVAPAPVPVTAPAPAAPTAAPVATATPAPVAAPTAPAPTPAAAPATMSATDADELVRRLSLQLDTRLDAIASKISAIETKVASVEAAAAQTVRVDATPIESAPETPAEHGDTEKATATGAEDDAMAHDDQPMQAIELMVRQNGRSVTGWALVRAGLRVLLHGSVKKGR